MCLNHTTVPKNSFRLIVFVYLSCFEFAMADIRPKASAAKDSSVLHSLEVSLQDCGQKTKRRRDNVRMIEVVLYM
jgi:hypothetical protein